MAVWASLCPSVASAGQRQSYSSTLASEVAVGGAVVEQKLRRRYKQQLRKLEADNLQRSRSKSRHNWMYCKSLFGRKLLFEYGGSSTGRRPWTTAKSKLALDVFSQSPAWRLQMSGKRLSQTLDKLLSLPQWCFERSRRSGRLAHSRLAVVNSTTPSFRMLLYRSIGQNCDVFDKRCESLGTKRLPVEVAVERLAALLCSHKRLLERKNLVVHKQSCRRNMALEQLVSAPEFVAGRSDRQRE